MDAKEPHQAEDRRYLWGSRVGSRGTGANRETKGTSTVSATFHSLKEDVLKQIWQNVNIH